MRYLISVYAALLFGALAGALIGYGVQQAVGQEGWTIVIGALGACAGAFWAGLRRADGKPVWQVRSAPSAEVDAPDGGGP